MVEKDAMSSDTEIALIGEKVEMLSSKVSELKDTFVGMVDEIHGHITREYEVITREHETRLQIELLKLETKLTNETDDKIKASTGGVKTTIKTWSSILVGTVILSFSAFTYITSQKDPGQDGESMITIEQATELYETVTREVTKSNKAYLKATKTTGSKSEIESIE